MKILRRLAAFLYLILYAVLWTGWWFHSSRSPEVAGYSWPYLVFLVAGLAGFCVPWAAGWLHRRFGPARFWLAAGSAGAALLLVYAGVAARERFKTRALFDIFVQIPPEPIPGPERDAWRVLCLGGSTTTCDNLQSEDRYPRQLEKYLSARYPNRRIVVLNAGKPWYTAQHSLINYVTYYRSWKPHVVIVMHAINDLYRSFSPPGYAVGEYNSRWSHFFGPVIHLVEPQNVARRWLALAGQSWFSSKRHRQEDMPVERFVSLGPFGVHLRTLIQTVRRDGVPIVVLSQPSLYKPQMSVRELDSLWVVTHYCRTRTGWLQDVRPTPLSMMNAMIRFNEEARSAASSEKACFLDLASQIPKDLEHFLDDVHYSPRGAQKVAGAVGEYLASRQIHP